MEKMIAYCGLICTDCDAYLATQADDDEQRKNVAVKWSKDYNVDIKPEEINCVGCIPTTGKHVGHCAVCEVRKCGQEKGVINCAYCDDYGCETLEGYFKMAPVIKENLDEVRKGLNK